MSSFVQHFSDGSVWGCIDDFFRHHEYGYIKLKDVSEWYNLSADKNWKNRVLSENTFHEAVKGLERIHPEPKAPEKNKEKTNPSLQEVKEKQGTKCTPVDTSILEKIREWIKTQEGDQIWIGNLFDLLTSLEKIEQPQYTPGQMIEVSNDGEKWKKRKFVENVPPNHDYLCEEYAFATRTWRFARPLEQVTIPEFDYEALCDLSYEKQPKNDDECDRLIVEGVGEHLEKITHFLHSQFPNSKPK